MVWVHNKHYRHASDIQGICRISSQALAGAKALERALRMVTEKPFGTSPHRRGLTTSTRTMIPYNDQHTQHTHHDVQTHTPDTVFMFNQHPGLSKGVSACRPRHHRPPHRPVMGRQPRQHAPGPDGRGAAMVDKGPLQQAARVW